MNMDVSLGHEPANQQPDADEIIKIDSVEARMVQSGVEIVQKSIVPNKPTDESNHGSYRRHEAVHTELMEQKHEIDAEDRVAESGTQEPDSIRNDLRAVGEDLTRSSTRKQVNPQSEDLNVKSPLGYSRLQLESKVSESTLDHVEPQTLYESENSTIEQLELNANDATENDSPGRLRDKALEKSEDFILPAEKEGRDSNLGYLGSPRCDEHKHPSAELLEQSERAATEKSIQSKLGDTDTSVRSTERRKSTSGPLVTCTRVLRSRSQEKPNGEPNNIVAEVTDDTVKKKERRKRKQITQSSTNEFSRIRNHLKYLLHRMKYEQNLIDAYSAEGWRGQSLEKLKPEKELQRAKSHILRNKLRIRDLLQRLDLSLAEGRFPESLFDSEGKIDSEDIFCAKCGSKDLPDGNDIILCDGACERGFHQFCLEPPLQKEDIPPGDELWLCPGCICKVDCIHLLNDDHGAKLSLFDSWEKVFPEAAAAASRKTLDGSPGFSSDDSEDDDYNPEKPELDEKVVGDETNYSKSDYFSSSDGLTAPPNSKQYLGLPSEDSEDDEYDPNAADHEVHVQQESSSSDFSSESEDLEDALYDNPDGGKLEVGRVNKLFSGDELSPPLDSNVEPVVGKRHVAKLDYEKLYDEMYGNDSTDSANEDYEKIAARKRRKINSGKSAPTLSKEPPVVETGGDLEPENHNQKPSKHTTKVTQKKLDVDGINNSSTSHESSLEARSSGKRRGPYKRLREEITQRLLESFKENQYPKRHVKEDLAKELGITIQQVDKWFGNTRWSCRHSSSMDSDVTAGASREQTSSLQVNEESPHLEHKND